MSTYALIQPSEDGTPIQWLNDSDMEDVAMLMEDCGITAWVEKYDDPNYWKEGEAMLIECTVHIPKPKKIVEQWEL